MHLFTGIQVVLVAILWIVKSTIAAIVFPLLVFLMIPLRSKLLPKFFSHEELEVVSTDYCIDFCLYFEHRDRAF